jgi:Non-histone chromosomal protein MC1
MNNPDKNLNRYFESINLETGEVFGRFTGQTPKQAASKAFTSLVQKLRVQNKSVPERTTIYLRESTPGSSRKIYGYAASRQKLAEPSKLVIGDPSTGNDKTITYHYRNKVEKVPVPQTTLGPECDVKHSDPNVPL